MSNPRFASFQSLSFSVLVLPRLPSDGDPRHIGMFIESHSGLLIGSRRFRERELMRPDCIAWQVAVGPYLCITLIPRSVRFLSAVKLRTRNQITRDGWRRRHSGLAAYISAALSSTATSEMVSGYALQTQFDMSHWRSLQCTVTAGVSPVPSTCTWSFETFTFSSLIGFGSSCESSLQMIEPRCLLTTCRVFQSRRSR